MTGISQLIFHKQANGSIIDFNGKPVGSELLGQAFSDSRFFHGRVSAYNYNTYIDNVNLCTLNSDNLGLKEMLHRFDSIEEKNKHLYLFAKDAAESESDLSIGSINVCSKCGYVLVGESPKECIFCHSPEGYFRF